MPRLSFVCALAAVALTANLPANARKIPWERSRPPAVHAVNDTLWVRADGRDVAVALAQLHGVDTTRWWKDRAMMIFSAGDTLVVPPDTIPARFWMVGARDSILEIVLFAGEYEVSDLDRAKVTLLRKHAAFSASHSPTFPSFTYPSADDSALTKLRTTYHLDSIAGSGDEFSRMTNLLHWVHRTVRHDGMQKTPPPDPATTLNCLAAAITKQQGFHCGLLAEIMTDCYLAVGIKARRLVCLPGDTLDTECHCVVVVWSDRLHKWILMDPTFDVWFTDKRGAPLGPLEIRAAMVAGDSLRLADCINWNGDTRSKVEHYYYMAKNLFRLKYWGTCAAREKEKAVRLEAWLIPDGYRDDLLGKVDSTTTPGYAVYHTDNAEWFFDPPPIDTK